MKGGMIHISSSASHKLRKFQAAITEGGKTRQEALATAGLLERDLFTIEQAAMCKTVVALDALDMSEIV